MKKFSPATQVDFVIIGSGPSCGQRRNEIAAMPFDLPGKLQSEQSRPHLPGWDFCHAGKFVDLDRHRSQKLDQAPLDVLRPYGGLRRGRSLASAPPVR